MYRCTKTFKTKYAHILIPMNKLKELLKDNSKFKVLIQQSSKLKIILKQKKVIDQTFHDIVSLCGSWPASLGQQVCKRFTKQTILHISINTYSIWLKFFSFFSKMLQKWDEILKMKKKSKVNWCCFFLKMLLKYVSIKMTKKTTFSLSEFITYSKDFVHIIYSNLSELCSQHFCLLIFKMHLWQNW